MIIIKLAVVVLANQVKSINITWNDLFSYLVTLSFPNEPFWAQMPPIGLASLRAPTANGAKTHKSSYVVYHILVSGPCNARELHLHHVSAWPTMLQMTQYLFSLFDPKWAQSSATLCPHAFLFPGIITYLKHVNVMPGTYFITHDNDPCEINGQSSAFHLTVTKIILHVLGPDKLFSAAIRSQRHSNWLILRISPSKWLLSMRKMLAPTLEMPIETVCFGGRR